MHVHPDIAALRSDRAPQRQAQRAMQLACNAWRAEPGAGEMLRELEQFGKGAPIDACAQLEQVFFQQGQAERLAGLLSRHYCRAIAENFYGHPPFRSGFDGSVSSIVLARSGDAQLIIQTREPGSFEHKGLVFSDAQRFDAVIAGAAQARIMRIIETGIGAGPNRDAENRAAASFSEEAIVLRPGVRLAYDLASETLQVDRVTRRLVMLRLLRTNPDPQPGREFAAETGRLLHQSAGTIATSRQEAIIALLGRMGRTDAAPAIAALALAEGDTSLRWQALRECLALDCAQGFCALCAIARRVDDPLAAAAGALRAQLLESYPELAQLEASRCRV